MEKPKLNHIGIVVGNIVSAKKLYASIYGFKTSGTVTRDPLQKVKVAFIELGNGVSIELIQPDTDDSPVKKFLEKGGGLYHLCYEVSDLSMQLKKAKKAGAIILGPPVGAKAFNGAKIAFIYTPDKNIVEFVEKR